MKTAWANRRPILICTSSRKSSPASPVSKSNATLPPASDEPYAAERPLLPKSLPEALDALEREPLFRRVLGDTFIDYFVRLKRSEAGRYAHSLEQAGATPGDEPGKWEQNEYFDFF